MELERHEVKGITNGYPNNISNLLKYVYFAERIPIELSVDSKDNNNSE